MMVRWAAAGPIIVEGANLFLTPEARISTARPACSSS